MAAHSAVSVLPGGQVVGGSRARNCQIPTQHHAPNAHTERQHLSTAGQRVTARRSLPAVSTAGPVGNGGVSTFHAYRHPYRDELPHTSAHVSERNDCERPVQRTTNAGERMFPVS